MERMEMVEKLREKANITMEEAKEILEKNDWDLLNAFVELEQNGRLDAEEKKEEPKKEEEKRELPVKTQRRKRSNRFCKAVRNVFRMGIDNKFVVKKGDEEIVKVPVILPAVCLAAAFWPTAIALFVGLVFNLKYKFEGKELGKDIINNTMEKASEVANGFVDNLSENKEETCEAKEQ